jgi:hypothetical protein
MARVIGQLNPYTLNTWVSLEALCCVLARARVWTMRHLREDQRPHHGKFRHVKNSVKDLACNLIKDIAMFLTEFPTVVTLYDRDSTHRISMPRRSVLRVIWAKSANRSR